MTPAERRAQELEKSSFLADPYSGAMIRRLAAALSDAEAYIRGLDSVNGPCLKDIQERHADALRDVREEA